MSWSEVFGDEITLSSGGSAGTNEHLKDPEFVLVLFSASWCPSCANFTPLLRDFYEHANSNSRVVEVVCVSADTVEDDYINYLGEYPWFGPFLSPPSPFFGAILFFYFHRTGVSFPNKSFRSALGKRYGVTGIPFLVILSNQPNAENDGFLEINKLTGRAEVRVCMEESDPVISVESALSRWFDRLYYYY